jgi:hypothetical protein
MAKSDLECNVIYIEIVSSRGMASLTACSDHMSGSQHIVSILLQHDIQNNNNNFSWIFMITWFVLNQYNVAFISYVLLYICTFLLLDSTFIEKDAEEF